MGALSDFFKSDFEKDQEAKAKSAPKPSEKSGGAITGHQSRLDAAEDAAGIGRRRDNQSTDSSQ